jgi:hypothetical protein
MGKDERALREKDRVHVLESAVVTWTRQIKNVLKLDPETVLKEVKKSCCHGQEQEPGTGSLSTGSLSNCLEELGGSGLG